MLISHILRDKGAVVHDIAETASLEDAARELHARRIGALVVIDQTGALAGVLSERDIVREIAKHGCERLSAPVSTAMTRSVITASPDESVEEGLDRMTDRRIRHLPVLDNGRLVGVVSIGDLVAARIAHVELQTEQMRAYIMTG